MTYTTDIQQAGNLYAVTLIGSDGLTVEVGAAPSIAAARRMARMAIAAGLTVGKFIGKFAVAIVSGFEFRVLKRICPEDVWEAIVKKTEGI